MSWRLDELGWLQFEELCQALLKVELGLGMEAWGGASDRGRDAYFGGGLPFPRRDVVKDGPFVFQAKFVSGANAPGARADSGVKKAVVAEAARIKHRIEAKVWAPASAYVLITNAPVNDALRTEIEKEIQRALPNAAVYTLGYRDVCATLDAHPRVRSSYPQVLGLRDLEELLRKQGNAGVLQRSRFGMKVAQLQAPKFVPTGAYNDAVRALRRRHFVMLTGAPEVGKTTLARMLGLSAITDECQVIECRLPDEFFSAYEEGTKQLFIADDAFGSTEFRPDHAQKWGDDMERVLAAVDRDHELVWTSRPAILSAALARMSLNGDAERFPDAGEVTVDVSRINQIERTLMLYRHARAADLDEAAKQVVKLGARSVISDEHFTPHRVATFVTNGLSAVVAEPADRQASALRESIRRYIAEPSKQMRNSLEALETKYRVVLMALLDGEVGAVSWTALQDSYLRLNGGGDLERLISDLKGHFLRVDTDDAGTRWLAWLHPSWRDLAIESTASTVADRQLFLDACGVNGVLLALSSEGGAEGQRDLPFLPTSSDVVLLRKTLARVAATSDDARSRLVNVADDLVAGRRSERPEIVELSEPILRVARDEWDRAGSVIPTSVLNSWWRASCEAVPLPASPNLEATWRALSGPLAELCADLDVDDPVDHLVAEVDEWLDLARVIARNEPRFLRAHGFPASYGAIWRVLVTHAEQELDWDRDDASTDNDFEEWAESFDDIARDLRAALLMNPLLLADAPTLLERLTAAANEKRLSAEDIRIEADAADSEPDDEDYYFARDEDGLPIDGESPDRVAESPPEDHVDVTVETVMADL